MSGWSVASARGTAAGFVALFAIVGATAAYAADKSQYNLFKPTPDALMREMTPDRPDTTESPFTVDAGHFQIETNILGYSRSFRNDAGEVTSTYDVMTTNVRIGLTNDIELSLVGQPYGVVRMRGPGTYSRQSGVGSFDVRAKFNLWGNDSFEANGATAFALIPYVTLPTDRLNGISVDKPEGGVIAAWQVKLNETYGLGLNASIAAERLGEIPAYRAGGVLTASLSRSWNDKLGTYYEAVFRYGLSDGEAEQFILGTGVTYKLNKNLQLDAGVNFGVTHSADRIAPFFGISARY